jgi:hypothetical protein
MSYGLYLPFSCNYVFEREDMVFGAARNGDIKHSIAFAERAKGTIEYRPAVSFLEGVKSNRPLVCL